MGTTYMPNTDSGKADLLDHLAHTLPLYKALLEINDLTLTTLTTDAGDFRIAFNTSNEAKANGQGWTAFKNILRDGGSDVQPWPVAFVPSQPTTSFIKPGVIPRLSALVTQIKAHKNYTEAIGKDLRIVASKQVINPSTWKPVLGIRLQADHPVIIWTKGNAAALEIWVDRGEGNFVLLAINIEPYTTDNGPLPPVGSSQLWRYKAIYILHDERVGQWSDIISVTVNA